MKKSKCLETISAILIIIALCLGIVIVCCNLFNLSLKHHYVYHMTLGASAVLAILSVVILSYVKDDDERKKKMMRFSVITMFALYIVMFIAVVVFTVRFLNKTPYEFGYNKRWLTEARNQLIPFASVGKTFRQFALGEISTLNLLFNILGNFGLYMPYAFFLPAVDKRYRTLDCYFPAIIFVVIPVEMLQGMFKLGTVSFDDAILGIIGALIMYFLLSAPKIREFFTDNYIFFE